MLLAGAIAWTAYTLSDSLPYWPVNPLPLHQPVVQLPDRYGALPVGHLALRDPVGRELSPGAGGRRFARGESADDPGRLVGTTYAANTVGAIVGALGFSVIFVPWIGSRGSERLLIVLSVVAALLVLLPLVPYLADGYRGCAWIARAVCGAVLAWKVHEVPWLAVAYGRRMLSPPKPASRCIGARG